MRLLNDRQHAEEVTQETLLQIWQHADRFDPNIGSATAWMFARTHARAVDRLRSLHASRQRDHHHASGQHHTPTDDTAEQVLRDADRPEVRGALCRLSAAQRESIVLAFFGGLTYPEIAAALGIPLPTVKTRIRDGIIRLRAILVTSTA